LRGTNNTYVKSTSGSDVAFNIECDGYFSVDGNIETLLDYATVLMGN